MVRREWLYAACLAAFAFTGAARGQEAVTMSDTAVESEATDNSTDVSPVSPVEPIEPIAVLGEEGTPANQFETTAPVHTPPIIVTPEPASTSPGLAASPATPEPQPAGQALPPAAPMPGPPAPVAAPAPVEAPVEEKVAITFDELKTLLSRGETPRVCVANRFGGDVTGRAVGIQGGKLSVDTTSEGVAVAGVMRVKLPDIKSLYALVAMSNADSAAASEASARYMLRIRDNLVAQSQPSPVSPVSPVAAVIEDIASTDAILSAASTESAIAAVPDRLSARDKALLETYPPEEGWGPARLGEIIRKQTVLHLEPFDADKSFMDDYDAWKEAYDRKRQAQLDVLALFDKLGEKPPADFEALPELRPVPSIGGIISPAPDLPVGTPDSSSPAGAPTGYQGPGEPTRSDGRPEPSGYQGPGRQLEFNGAGGTEAPSAAPPRP